MLKSILKVFSGAFGMIIRVMVIIGLCFLGGYCLFSMLARPFFWGGLIRLAGLLACGLAIFGILRLSRDPDDRGPSGDDFRP